MHMSVVLETLTYKFKCYNFLSVNECLVNNHLLYIEENIIHSAFCDVTLKMLINVPRCVYRVWCVCSTNRDAMNIDLFF